MPRRLRKPNYTHEETMILLELLDLHKYVIFCKGSNQERSDLWSDITVAVNSLPNSAGRTKKELKHRWKDLTHRMRLLEKKLKETNSHRSPSDASPYYDLVMKILGEKNEYYSSTKPEGIHLSNLGAEEDCPKDWTDTSNHDIKPDRNLCLALLSNTNTDYVSSGSAAVAAMTNGGTEGADSSTSVKSTTDTNSCDTGKGPRKPAGTSRSRKQPKPQCIQPVSSSTYKISHLTAYDHEAALSPHCGQPHPTMRLDPYTQEVLAVDELETDSDSEDGIYFQQSVPSGQERLKDSLLVNGDVFSYPSTTTTSSSFKRKRKSSCEDSYLQSLSLEELKEVYLVKKIQMVSQRTKCLKLLEEKLEYQLQYLRQSHQLANHQLD